MTLEQKLKRALKSKDPSKIHIVFEEIYHAYGKLVYFTIMQYVKNNMDVEDLTQDVFLNFFNNLLKNEIKNIKYYLVVSAKNRAINFINANQNKIVLDENIIYEQEQQDDYNENYFIIISNMKKYLNEFEIDIIIQHAVYDYSFKDLANKYDKSINTIISTYHRAVKKYLKGADKNEKK